MSGYPISAESATKAKAIKLLKSLPAKEDAIVIIFKRSYADELVRENAANEGLFPNLKDKDIDKMFITDESWDRISQELDLCRIEEQFNEDCCIHAELEYPALVKATVKGKKKKNKRKSIK